MDSHKEGDAAVLKPSDIPPEGSGLVPGPGMPPARFAGWQPWAEIPEVPLPEHRVAACMPGLTNFCNPGSGKCVVPAMQPIIPVPVYQEIIKKDRIVEIPRTVIKDQVTPNVTVQPVEHEVPHVEIIWNPKLLTFEKLEITETPVEIEVPVGYNFKVIPKWEIREVPKVIPKYVGKQEVIQIPVPKVKVVDKHVEKEVPVYVGEKIVEKEVVEVEEEEIVQCKYIEVEEEVPIYTYKPVFDVEVEIPPPLVVPVPLKPEQVIGPSETVSWESWKASH